MKILLTGGAGFIGSHCANAFLAKGHKVVIVDNLSSGKRLNVPPKTKFYHLDIRDKKLKEIITQERPDCICHHAAHVSVRTSVDDPVMDADINIVGSINLVNMAVKFGIGRFIFSSSGGTVYGEQEEFPAKESHPARPISPHGVAKYSFEKYLDYYRQVFGLRYCILRYANVYGPRQYSFGDKGVVAIFCQRMLEGKQPVINGDGEQTRDLVYVDDVARANVLALDLKESHCFNIGTGKETSINKIFSLLKNLTGVNTKKVHGPEKKGDLRRSCISYQLAMEHLGWRPDICIEDGLALTVGYYRSEVKR